MSVRTATAVVVVGIAVYLCAIEFGARRLFPRFSGIQQRVVIELAASKQIRPVEGNAPTVLLAGNSLLGSAVHLPQLAHLAPELRFQRILIESTSYYDWYFGLESLFRDGSKPAYVVLFLSPRQILSSDFRGDYSAGFLLDPRAVLDYSRATDLDATSTTNLIFANGSEFYAVRAEIRKKILTSIIPGVPGLSSKLRRGATTVDLDRARPVLLGRLIQLRTLCERNGSKLVIATPPTGGRFDPNDDVLKTSGTLAKVPVLLPLASGSLGDASFSDGFHLNENGASVFTAALAPDLLRTVRYHSADSPSFPILSARPVDHSATMQ